MKSATARATNSTQVLIDLRSDINNANDQLINDTIEVLESADTPEQRRNAYQLLMALDRDIIASIADRLGIATTVRFGYAGKPLSKSILRNRIACHYNRKG